MKEKEEKKAATLKAEIISVNWTNYAPCSNYFPTFFSYSIFLSFSFSAAADDNGNEDDDDEEDDNTNTFFVVLLMHSSFFDSMSFVNTWNFHLLVSLIL